MPRFPRFVIIIATTIAGLFFIGFNVYLTYFQEPPAQTGAGYLLLGILIIAAGLYISWLYGKHEQLKSDYSDLEATAQADRQEKEKLEAEHAQLQGDYQALKKESTHQRKVPKICDMVDENVLPPLSAEQLHIMQQLFWGSYRIHVRPLEGGFNNFGVFQVIPEPTERNLARPGVVVKFLSYRDIRKEKSVYQTGGVLREHPLAHTPGRPTRNWPSNRLLVDSRELGAVVYQLAMLDADSQLQTLKNLYKQLPFEKFVPYLKLLFERLDRWYGLKLPEAEGRPLGGPNGVYERLRRRCSDIQKGIAQLLKTATTAGTPALPINDVATAQLLELPFLPEKWNDEKFSNPVYWINNILVPGQAQSFQATSPYSPVHGDLHTGNILVEKGKDTHIWLIDFPNAHIGPSLQDFATLEADVKFNLIDMRRVSLDTWLGFEEHLLAPLRSPYYALDSPWFQNWQPNEGELLKAWKLIGFLRHWVRERQIIGVDVRAYYLALLHATLPVVYRRSHSEVQKQCALTSAAWMCEHLSS
ncbi:MAG: phosphotransferase [Nitrospiria bacterium]